MDEPQSYRTTLRYLARPRRLAQTPVLWGLRSPEGTLFRQGFCASILSGGMPFYKRTYSSGQLQFITTSTYRRAPLFLSQRFCRCFVQTLAEARQEMKFLLLGWVLMPAGGAYIAFHVCDPILIHLTAPAAVFSSPGGIYFAGR